MEMINKYHTTHDTNEYGLATQYFYFWTHYSENMPIVAHASELAYGMSLPVLLSVVSSLTMPCDDDDDGGGGDDDDEYTNLCLCSVSALLRAAFYSYIHHFPSPPPFYFLHYTFINDSVPYELAFRYLCRSSYQ
jgi:hypothetical protein